MSWRQSDEQVPADWPLEMVERIDRICDRFESTWRKGEPSAWHSFVPSDWPSEFVWPLMRELLMLDLEYRKARGETTVPKDYSAASGEHADRVNSLVKEWVANAETGDAQRSLYVRCPHCQERIETFESDSFVNLICPACTSSFSLLGDRGSAPRGTIAQFKLLKPLGEGRFGTVWLARDAKLNRLVALKLPRRGQFDPETAELFLREARAAAQLNHPNIVGVHEMGRDDDTIYIASHYVRGMTLAEWLCHERPTPVEAAELCAKIAETLHVAHEMGIVHRDVKPSNILIDKVGEPHVMDFGLARRDSAEVTMTMAGQVLGTPAYMSPEQARGEVEQTGARSDLYAVGVMLYEMLTGVLPFQGNVRMLLHQVMHDEPRPPRRLNDRIPRDLEMICLKSLAKEPTWRYGSAADLAADLRRFVGGQPVHARRVGWLARLGLWCRRPKRVVEAGLVLAVIVGVQTLLAACGAVIYGWGLSPRGASPQIALNLVVIIVVFYIPLLWLAVLTLRKNLTALWVAAVSQLAALVLAVGHLGGWMHFFDELGGLLNSEERLRHWIAYAAMALVCAGYCSIALVAYYSNRNVMRWSRTSQLKNSTDWYAKVKPLRAEMN